MFEELQKGGGPVGEWLGLKNGEVYCILLDSTLAWEKLIWAFRALSAGVSLALV